ncbi:hypothetical protein C8F01DRAFT_1265680 [Mycena amicta]|nr:hypothetical protein C8F01DRAFT_1265680 [Mycena amicta]
MPASPSRPPRQVRWNLSIEAFSATNTPESWTAHLPGTGSPPEFHEQLPLSQTPPRTSTFPPRLPPTPHPNADVPLPNTAVVPAEPQRPQLELHPALTPAQPLRLDFSFPSAAFQANPLLTPALLATPACTPPRASLVVRLSTPSSSPAPYKTRLEVRSTTGFVTIGDVLSRIQRTLRAYDSPQAPASPTTSTTPTSTSSASSGSTSGSPRTTPSPSSPTFPPELIALYATRRILTVNGFCADRPLSVQAAHIDAERAGGTRMVDRFVGHTMFAGLVPLPADGNYQLDLIVPQRYLLAPPTPPSPKRREVSR